MVNTCWHLIQNDYLGLANEISIRQAFIEGIERWGVGAGSAHLISGHTKAHHQLEEELADWLGRERVLLFSTGYMANLGVLGALASRGDLILEDRLNHASLIDGARLSNAHLHRYAHLDVTSAATQLASREPRSTILATDGVFSMDGDIAPLAELSRVCRQHQALMLVDDAHGLGVLGATGCGSLALAGIPQEETPLLMGTFGKAFGVFGAFVAGSETLIETLMQAARSYIYTTAMPAALAEAVRAALKRVMTDDWRRDKLQQLINHLRLGAKQLELELMPSDTAIQPLLIGEADAAVRWSQMLEAEGILVNAIRPPTVPIGTARLRITLSAAHELSDVDMLLVALDHTRPK